MDQVHVYLLLFPMHSVLNKSKMQVSLYLLCMVACTNVAHAAIEHLCIACAHPVKYSCTQTVWPMARSSFQYLAIYNNESWAHFCSTRIDLILNRQNYYLVKLGQIQINRKVYWSNATPVYWPKKLPTLYRLVSQGPKSLGMSSPNPTKSVFTNVQKMSQHSFRPIQAPLLD